MVQHHKYSITELENQYPFERDLTVQFLLNAMEEIDEKRKNLTPITEKELEQYGLKEKYGKKNKNVNE